MHVVHGRLPVLKVDMFMFNFKERVTDNIAGWIVYNTENT